MTIRANLPTTNTICPFVKEPWKDCYCVNMNSSRIYFAIRFCGGEYSQCRLYRAAIGKTPKGADEGDQSRNMNHFPSSRKVSG